MSSILSRIDFDSVLKELKRRNVRTVGVQLPDGLKYFSKEIAEKLGDFEVLISASPSFGACDVDTSILPYVDVLLHFAHEPIFELDGVIYVPYRVDFHEESVKHLKIKENRIALIAAAQYAWKLESVKAILENEGYEVELKKGSGRVKLPGQVLGCNYSALKGSGAGAVLFIGDGLFHPVGAAIYTGKKVYRFSPLSKEFEEVDTGCFLKERMLIMSKALNAESFGIVVSTKIGQNRLNLARKLKKIAERSGKKSDIIITDNFSVENFNYECYVNTACPRIAYDDHHRRSKPIITPQELEIVVGLRSWEQYKIDEIL